MRLPRLLMRLPRSGERVRPGTLLVVAALLAVVALASTWPASRMGESVSAVPAAAGESHVKRAQRIRRAPTEEEKPAEPPTETPTPARPEPVPPTGVGPDLSRQTQLDVDKKNAGCVSCHTKTDAATMHEATTVKAACIDCHGGQGDVVKPADATAGSAPYDAAKRQAHVRPRVHELWKTSANPERSFATLNQESAEFIRFVNPGDLRAARQGCGQTGCHATEVALVQKSMMATGPMLWAAALYNNGTFPRKLPRFGESYDEDGRPRRLYTIPAPTPEETLRKGILPFLDPLPRFEVGQPSNVLRVFERGQQRQLELGVPFVDEAPGKPTNRLSQRGFGTLNRTDPVWLNLQRTRLLDPMLSFLGTNDQPGDYRSSGCSGCHVVYANDRSPTHSAHYAEYGNRARSVTEDPTIPKNESGHPIKHVLTNRIPSSQCVTCHHHPGTTVTNSYLGYIWWDNETDGQLLYPSTDQSLSASQVAAIQARNPEGAALRGKWSDPEFLANVVDLNPRLSRMQFGDFHGHGWIFRAVFKHDRKGNMLDAAGKLVPHDDPDRFKKAVHLKDIHLEKGMHCVDCHFKQDAHGNGKLYGEVRAAIDLGHADTRMTCLACHTAWVTSCFGCHLPMKANERKPALHNEPDIQRNWTPYNFQTIRDDVFMLAIDPTVMKHRIAPARSSCAILVGSQNPNREWVYSQQQTVSAEGFSGHAFSTFVPHTVRATETRGCSDCHVSSRNDNNAWMAQVLMQGTNFYNFIGRYAWVAEGDAGLEAVVVTEREEPQAVIGSALHQDAYPTSHERHVAAGRTLSEAYHHRGRDVLDFFGGDQVLGIQLRGEYLYTANGRGGFRAYDVAQIDQKGFSQRLFTAPVSPLGQRLYVKTKFATAVASPSTLAVDPTRTQYPQNQEQKIPLVYAFLYVADKYEGLVVIGNPLDSKYRPGVATLLDGDPTNNFLERAATFNPDGVLDGAVNLTVAGTYAYVLADTGLVIVSLADPLKPSVVAVVGTPNVVKPRAVAVQFRYAFVTDSEGLKVIDVTTPERPRPVPAATVRLPDAHGVYLARTYAYVAAGKQGLVIVDVERPETPAIDQVFDAGGIINDARDVKVGMTNTSLFAYVADGVNGLRVIQLTSPAETPTYLGFSPRPAPRLIATKPTRGAALAVSKGTDRDRAVDESGNQIAVFNRLGSRSR